MPKIYDTGKRQVYEDLWVAIITSCFNGQRIHYTEPSIQFDDRIGMATGLVFKIKQQIRRGDLQDLMDLEFGTAKKNIPRGIDLDLYMNRICQEIKEATWEDSKRPFSHRINFKWPAAPIEEWLEETHDCHWMTAKWFSDNDKHYGNFAILLSVYAPIPDNDIQKYKDSWGSAIVLTKLGEGIQF